VIDSQLFCVHGGLSPNLTTLDQIQMLPRRIEIPTSGPCCDLMWSDPDESVVNWNLSVRGAGHLFGEKVAREVFFFIVFM
jgi:diadenosine tetraphosphatase ApaH/serine/threonine PP2A family protein phosphatase